MWRSTKAATTEVTSGKEDRTNRFPPAQPVSLAAYLHIGLRMLGATLRNGGFQPWGQAFFPFLDLYMPKVESIILGLFIPLSWFMSTWQDFPQHCYANITGRTKVIIVKEFETMEENGEASMQNYQARAN